MWMGWVTCTDKNGDITKVDKSWGYKRDKTGTHALFCIIRRCPINQSEFWLNICTVTNFWESRLAFK